MDKEASVEEFEDFLAQHKKNATIRLVKWLAVLAVTTVAVIGGMFWLFQSAVDAFMR